MKKAEVKAIAEKLEAEFNPYLTKATKYFKGFETVYLFNGTTYTRDEMRDAYVDTAMKDIQHGYDDRMVGYYDKWYRYCHADEGRAYDKGSAMATLSAKCSQDFHIIECAH